MDAGKDRAVCAGTVIQCELKELLRLLHCLAGFYLYGTEIGLAEGIKVDLLLEERLYFYLREVDLVVRGEESVVVACRCLLRLLCCVSGLSLCLCLLCSRCAD